MEEIEKNWLCTSLMPVLVKSGNLLSNHGDAVIPENALQSLKVLDIAMQFIGSEESFMLTNCYKTRIIYELCGKRSICNLMVKKTPNVPEDIYESIDFATLFSNEISAYTIILPTLINFLKTTTTWSKTDSEQRTNDEDIVALRNFPKFYYSDLQRVSATVVLGDFSENGWRMSAKRVNLSLEHIFLAVEYIASFHGINYALKEFDRSKFDTMIGQLRECRYAKPPNPKWQSIMKTGVSRTLKAAKKFYSDIPKSFLDQLGQLFGDPFEYHRKRVMPIEPFAILCHGDYLRNNIAFRYDNSMDTENPPTQVMMFDLQTMRYSSPMIDLTTLLSLSCGKAERSKHFNEIFSRYSRCLVSAYKSCLPSVDIPDFMNEKQLIREYIRYLPYSLVIASSFLMTLHDPQNVTTEELLRDDETEEELTADILSRGGETVDRELASLVKELFELTHEYNVDIFNEFL